MKKQLDFKAPFSCMCLGVDFINCFAAVYVHIEGIGDKVARKCGNVKHGLCGACKYQQFFDAMAGASFTRRHYGGTPTEMQKLIGNHGDLGCGTDDTAGFLFGFAGYEYRKQMDPGAFKAAIAASIDAGKPVIAKIKPGETRFRVITGYSGNKLLEPDYKRAQKQPKKPVKIDELEALYIFGEKIQPRYAVLDGLKRTQQMMECNASEKVWDKYIEEIQDKIMLPPNADWNKESRPEEQEKVLTELKDAAWCAWGVWNFLCAFEDWMPGNIAEKNPTLDGLADESREQFSLIIQNIWDKCCESMDLGHFINYLSREKRIQWHNAPCPWHWLGKLLVMMVERYKELDAEVLELIKQAITILSHSL